MYYTKNICKNIAKYLQNIFAKFWHVENMLNLDVVTHRIEHFTTFYVHGIAAEVDGCVANVLFYM